MTEAEAKEIMAFHSGSSPKTKDPRWVNGFLGCLRPYQGKLREENFIELMSAIIALRKLMTSPGEIQLQATRDVHRILYEARLVAVYPKGMLRRNNLITDDDVSKLEEWLDIVGYTWLMILECADDESILSRYKQYLSANEQANQ